MQTKLFINTIRAIAAILIIMGTLLSPMSLSVSASFPGIMDRTLSGPAQDQSPSSPRGFSPLANGGPDEYGYTWDEAVTQGWINTSGGVDTGIKNPSGLGAQIDIGFSFKFYENYYTKLNIFGFGYLSFQQNYHNSSAFPTDIPSPSSPNDIIAPLWDYYPKLNGYIHYLRGGSEPERWIAIEWNRLSNFFAQYNEITFEAILYEGSNKIVFLYDEVNAMSTARVTGIKNSTGLDGLKVADYTIHYPAVGIYRPAPSARVGVSPLTQGGFAAPGKTADLLVSVKNIGELGTDTYDLIPSAGWTTSLYAADGTTPLIDTDGDGTIDTGPVAQDAAVNIVTKVQAPPGAQIGDANSLSLTARSALNVAKTKTVNLQAAVPAPFAQAFQDAGERAMSLYLVQPGGQQVKNVVPNWNGYRGAVAELPNGNFIYTWYTPRFIANNTAYVWEIEYTIANKFGEIVKGVTKILDNSDPVTIATDEPPVVAVAPNGKIGILWKRSLSASGQTNSNIFLEVLDPSGNVVFGPASVTNNSIWGKYSDLYFPRFIDPTIAATGDNRFVMAWNKDQFGEATSSCTSSCFIDDIYYAVRDTSGSQVKEPTRLTFDTSNTYDGYYDANLASLAGNEAILSWDGRSAVAGMYYAVIDSAGNLVKTTTNLGSSGDYFGDIDSDAVQLSNGNSIIAWTGGDGAFIRYAVLDGNHNVIFGPSNLDNPANMINNSYVSVSADASGRAILTWIDSTWCTLYYALVNSDGSVITQPMIFYTARTGPLGTQVVVSEGYANTSYSSFPAGVDASISLDRSWFGGAPGGVAVVDFHYANHGGTSAAGVTLTATLDSHLAYLNDTSGVTPTINGSQVTWQLPNLGFLEEGHFTLRVKVLGTAVIGTSYPLTLALTSDGPENNPADNTTNAQVFAGYQTNLPVIRR